MIAGQPSTHLLFVKSGELALQVSLLLDCLVLNSNTVSHQPLAVLFGLLSVL